jgi:hypothetical protein
MAAIVTVPAAVGHASPDRDRGMGTGASVTYTVTSGTNARDIAATPYVTGNRPCFMVRARWSIALDGSQPVCGSTVSQVEGERARNRPFGNPEQRAAVCPAPPDIRYVGVPWVPPQPTGCASIDRWWTFVTPARAGR